MKKILALCVLLLFTFFIHAQTGFAYVPGQDPAYPYDKIVCVIDITTNAVVAKVPVGGSPRGVSVSPDGSRVYFANTGGNTVFVINTTTNTLAATVNVGPQPQGIVVSPDGSHVYVANTFDHTISVINTATNTVTTTFSVSSVGTNPCGLALSPDGSRLYVTNLTSDNVTVINTTTNAIVATVPAGGRPIGVCVSPDGSRAYVANYLSRNVTVINTVTNSRVTTIPIVTINDYGPYGIAITPDGNKVYLANKESDSVYVISTATNTITARLAVGEDPNGVSISPDGSRVYVTNFTSNNVSVINTATNTVVATVGGMNTPIVLGNFVTASVDRTKFYVNDNNQSGDVFTTAVGNNANNGSQSAPFATLTYALSKATEGDTIYVDAGTYAEQVTIDKGVTIIGAGQNLTSIVSPASPLVPPPGPFPEYALIQTTQNIGDVHISNLKTTNIPANEGHSMLLQTGGSVKNCKIIDGSLGVYVRVESAAKTVVVENNSIQSSVFAVAIQGSGMTASVLNNTLNVTNPYFSVGIWVGLDFGPIAKLIATGNAITNYVYRGIVGNSYNTVLTENSILGTGQFAIENTASPANATCNWYGSSDQYVVASKMNGTINFSPWLVNGTDNDAATGFQPVPNSCAGKQLFFVNDNSLTGDIYTVAVGSNANNGSYSAPLATITDALAKAQPGDLIIIDAGSYTEIVNINKNITILGAGKGVTIINGPAGNITPYPNTSETGIIQTLNGLIEVNIENLTVDGTASNEQHGIFIQGGGRVANCELRYVNDGFYFQYLSTQPRTAQGYNNYVHHINYVGSLFAGNGMTAIANNNVIDLTGAQYGIGFIAGYGGAGNVASFTASNNSIVNINGFGIMLGSLQTSQVHNNSLARAGTNYLFIQNVHSVSMDATCNWYGTSDAGVIIPYITGAVTYSPWLSNGTDNDVAFGFQPVPGSCNGRQNKLYVNDNSLTNDIFTTAVGNDANTGIPSAPLLTLNAALNKAQAGDSIFIDAGTYATADIIINKAITILGTNYLISPNNAADRTLYNTARNAEARITGSKFTIGADNIYISGLRLSPATTAIFMNANYSHFKFDKIFFDVVGTGNIVNLQGTSGSPVTSFDFGITDCRFERTDILGGNSINLGWVKNVWIGNNTFIESPAGNPFRGVGLRTTGGQSVENTIFSNNYVKKLNVGVAPSIVQDFHVNNNIFDSCFTGYSHSPNAAVSNNIYINTNTFKDLRVGRSILVRGGGNGGVNNLNIMDNIINQAVDGISGIVGMIQLDYAIANTSGATTVSGNKINITGNYAGASVSTNCGIILQGEHSNTTISNNELSFSAINWAYSTAANAIAPIPTGIFLSTDNGTGSGSIPASALISILNNKINGFKNSIGIYDPNPLGVTPAVGYGYLPAGAVVNINYNSFTGDSTSIDNGTVSQSVNASCNWYGSAAAQNFITKLSLSTVDIVPWLNTGTDNDPATGFQPVAGACDGYPTLIILDNYSNVTCNGAANGAINISVSYGKAPFNFTWTKDGDANFISHAEDPSGLAPGTYHLSIIDGNGSNIYITSTEADGPGTIDVTITEPTVLTANANGTNVSCNGGNNGTASVTAGGSTLPYSYLWSNGSTNASISNLIAGLYTVTVTDGNGCTKTASYQVTQPSVLTANGNGTNVSCFGGNNGTASVTPGGGTLPYSYSWSNGSTNASISNLIAGLYTVTFTDGNGCTKTASYQVTQPALLTAVATGTSTSCANSATVVASGGTLPYFYSWSNGATTQSVTSLPAGTFTVTVTDGNGCQATSNCTVTATEAFNPSASVVNVSCYGGSNGSITVTNANGVAPFQYSINGVNFQSNNTFSGLAAGTYSVTVKDVNGCAGFVSKTITQSTQIVVSQGTVQSTCVGSNTGSISIIVSGGSPSYSYLWSGPNGYSSTQGNISGLAAGNYNVIVTDSKGCTASLPVTVNPFPAINVNANVINVGCRGDASGSIDLTVTGGTGSGFTYLWTGGFTTQDRFNLVAGNYSVTITDIGSGCTLIRRDTIIQPASAINLSATSTNVGGCNTLGTITATGSGGTAPYQYKLDAGVYQSSGSFTGLPGGTFTVWVKDANGCIKSIAKIINDGGGDEFENNNNKNNAAAISLGTTISSRIGTSGDIDYFKLNPSNTWNGTYTMNFVQPATAVTFDLVGSNGSTIIAPTSSSSTYKQYTGLNGTYFVRVSGTNSLSCYQLTVTSGLLTRSSGSNVQQEVTKAKSSKDIFNVGAYPNPSNTSFNIKIESSSDEPVNMRVMDASGRLIEEKKNINASQIIKLGEQYINGVYLVEIIQGNNRKTTRLVKM